jgi:hypothetical protein
VAGVVGFVLILAVAISYYAYVAKSDVPKWGEENENAWNQNVGDAMTSIARDAATGVANHANVDGTVPRPPPPHSFDIPLLGSTQPVRPDATVRLDANCANWTINIAGGPELSDTGGCLDFQASPVYTQPFSYFLEYGALIQNQSGSVNGLITSGPPLKLRVITNGTNNPIIYQVALTMLDLRGPPGESGSAGSTNVPVDLLPSTSDVDSTTWLTSSAVWTFNTNHTAAWQSWLQQRLLGAGMANTTADACVAGYSATPPCVQYAASLALNQVALVVNQPSPSPGSNVAFSLTEGVYDVNIR